MEPRHILFAENYDVIYAILAIVCFAPLIVGFFGFFLMKRWPWIGLVCGWGGIIIGGLLIFVFATTRGGAMPALWVIAALPLVMGIVYLIKWKNLQR